jgi:serine/threonine-protein kinase
LYAEAFRSYFGIDLPLLEPEEAAARVGNSAIRETLVAYLHDWLYWAFDAYRPELRAVLDRADGDPWRRAFREALLARDTEVVRTRRMGVLAEAPEAVAQPPLVLSGLGGILLMDGHREEARAFLSKAQQRHPGDFWLNYLLGQYWEQERPQVAAGYFRAAVAIRPSSDEGNRKLGRTLLDSGDAEGAIAAFREAVALNPNSDAGEGLTTALTESGRLEEARATWAKRLELDPPAHDAWNGYAELCLFLGREHDYRRVRRDLLIRFGATTDPYIAERTSRACLLLPATGNELRQAVALAERAAAVDRSQYASAYPWFVFAQGLAEYRQGQFDRAISTMRGDARTVLGPSHKLVLAMALHQKGRADEARKTLALAILSYDWRANQVRNIPSCIPHVLRREAESMILPNVRASNIR